ncbi:MAG TPA: laminarinase [Thermosipho africanus]|nr:laminarinase [Thermosipho africanus]
MSTNQILFYISIGLLSVLLIGGFIFNNLPAPVTSQQENAVEESTTTVVDENETTSVTPEVDLVINNGTFDEPIANDPENPYRWWIWQASDYNISNARVSSYGVKDGYAYLKVKYPGGETWHIQFNQWIKLERGATYEVSFKAKADIARKIWLNIAQNHEPWASYLPEPYILTYDLTTEWQTFTFEYTHPEDADEIVNFSFQLGLDKPTTIYFDDISLVKK